MRFSISKEKPSSANSAIAVAEPKQPAPKEPPVLPGGDPLAKLRSFVADESWVKRANRLLVEASQTNGRVQQLIVERNIVERNRIQLTRNGDDPDKKICDLSTKIRAAESEAKGKKAKARELIDAKIADLGPASGGIWRIVVSKRQEILAAVEKLQELFLGSASSAGQNIASGEKLVSDYNRLVWKLWDVADALVPKTGGPALSIKRPQMRFTRHTGLTEEVEAFLKKFRDVLR